jgi:hypothetical protein
MLRATLGAGLVAFAACSEHDLDLAPQASFDAVQQGQLDKPADVRELDALVEEINGYASKTAYVVDHPKKYDDETDARFASVRCGGVLVNELGLRLVTRSRKDQRLRRLVLEWSSAREKENLVTYEAYHYDETGALRVVVVDRETDHSLDEAFMKDVSAYNASLSFAIAQMPRDTESERVAIAQKGQELHGPLTIVQYRVYFRPDGTPFYETRRDGLELARMADYPDIPEEPPILYGVHPANVTAAPFLVALSPAPRYSARALPEAWVTAAQPSIRSELIAANLRDGELSLRAPPVCR